MNPYAERDASLGQARSLGLILGIPLSSDLIEAYVTLRMAPGGGSDQAVLATVLLVAGEPDSYDALIKKFAKNVTDLPVWEPTVPALA